MLSFVAPSYGQCCPPGGGAPSCHVEMHITSLHSNMLLEKGRGQWQGPSYLAPSLMDSKPIRRSLVWEHHSRCISHRQKFKILYSRSLYWNVNVLPFTQSRARLCFSSFLYWDGDTSFFLLHHTTLSSSLCHRLFSSPSTESLTLCTVLVTECNFWDASTLPRAVRVAVDFSCRSSSSLSFPLSHHMFCIFWASQTPLSIQCCLLLHC